MSLTALRRPSSVRGGRRARRPPSPRTRQRRRPGTGSRGSPASVPRASPRCGRSPVLCIWGQGSSIGSHESQGTEVLPDLSSLAGDVDRARGGTETGTQIVPRLRVGGRGRPRASAGRSPSHRQRGDPPGRRAAGEEDARDGPRPRHGQSHAAHCEGRDRAVYRRQCRPIVTSKHAEGWP
jgi:hypothetical protein